MNAATVTMAQAALDALGIGQSPLREVVDYLSAPPANSHLVNGLYRNDLGAELHITGGWITPMGSPVMSIGGIYVAESRDRLFGTVIYHVTPESMRAARYELIEEGTS